MGNRLDRLVERARERLAAVKTGVVVRVALVRDTKPAQTIAVVHAAHLGSRREPWVKGEQAVGGREVDLVGVRQPFANGFRGCSRVRKNRCARGITALGLDVTAGLLVGRERSERDPRNRSQHRTRIHLAWRGRGQGRS